MKPIAIFYHCLFYMGEPPMLVLNACDIVRHQMTAVRESGLLKAAEEIHAGINGGQESNDIANIVLPHKATRHLHGLQCHNECRTILTLEQWLPDHPGWNVLYFHSKGATRPPGDGFSGTWRNCMMKHAVLNWKRCVDDLANGYEAVGSHWMEPPATPAGHHIFAGNFWWATSDFLRTLPSIMERDRIKTSGIDSADSRYESEVWLGNGSRVPWVKDYHGPNWNPSKMATCNNA